MVDSILATGSKSNCEDDVDTFLLTLGRSDKPMVAVPIEKPPTTYEQMMTTLPMEINEECPLRVFCSLYGFL